MVEWNEHHFFVNHVSLPILMSTSTHLFEMLPSCVVTGHDDTFCNYDFASTKAFQGPNFLLATLDFADRVLVAEQDRRLVDLRSATYEQINVPFANASLLHPLNGMV